jgi:hypothetical protein
METSLIYLATALVGFYWSASLALAGRYGAPTPFAWGSAVLFIGSVLLVGCAAMKRSSKQRRARWLAVIGSGILSIYFILAAVTTLWDYARGEAILSQLSLGRG